MKKEDEVKKQLKWRLAEKPTVDSIQKMVELEIITKQEAKQLLVSEEDAPEPKTLIDLQKEVELLRELVLDVAKREPTVRTIIERHFDHTPYRPWKYNYINPFWVTAGDNISGSLSVSFGATNNKNGNFDVNPGDTLNMSALKTL